MDDAQAQQTNPLFGIIPKEIKERPLYEVQIK